MFFRFLSLTALVFTLPWEQVCAQDLSRQDWSVPAADNTTDPGSGEESNWALAEDYDNAGAAKQALDAYRRFLKLFPASPKAAQAQLRVAELYMALGNRGRAFDAYETLITKYPDTPNFEEAIAQQVIIANSYLTGRRVSLLGLSFMPGPERAQSMYEKILANAPFSKHAPITQFNLGLAFEKQGLAEQARQSYQTVLDRYPSSSVADDALYQMGYIAMRTGLSGRSEDLSALVLAKETFEDFLLQFPNSEKADQARENLKTIGDREAGDLMEIARWYDWSKNYRAAAIYYNDVIRRQPGSEDAEVARNRVQVLRADLGDEALRVGAERAESGERAALRRRLQAEVETSALSDYAGPPRRDLVPDELPVARPPQLRTGVRDLQPMPAVEPALPAE
jgi:outer membrane protein assembly factor BamD